MIELITSFLKKFGSNYQSDLEQYINSRYPKTEGDVERLLREYNDRLTQGKYY